MEKQIFSDFIDKYRDAEMVVIGIGEEWNAYLEKQEYQDLLAFYAPYLEKKNYFCITSSKKNDFSWGSLNPKRVVQPLLLEAEQITSEKKEEVEKQWDLYNKWLSGTLAKKLLVVELGEGFNNPNLIKWPFERIVMINEKARFYRIHSMFYQIPPEIKDKSVTYKYDAYEVLKTLVNMSNH